MEAKELIDSIIRDLTNDAPVSRIMLKAQAIASTLGLADFAEWVRKEQNGYVKDDDIPDYRKTQCSAKVNLTQGWKSVTNFDVPIDALSDKTSREMLSYIYSLTLSLKLKTWLPILLPRNAESCCLCVCLQQG